MSNLALQLATTENFEGNPIEFYKNNQDFYLTRTSIGKALEYKNPKISLSNIHKAHKERLDKFSTVTELITLEGNRRVKREVVTYSYRGLCEICRYSEQPNADKFMDWVWDIIEGLRTETKQTADKSINELPTDNISFTKAALTQLKQQQQKLNYIEDLSKQHTDSIMEIAFDVDKQKQSFDKLKANLGKILKLVENNNYNSKTNNELIAHKQINTYDDMLNTTVQFYEKLRQLATTENGYLGDAYILTFKRLLGRYKNKRLVLKSGFNEQTIFENFQYEFHEAITYDNSKSFACFLLKCGKTGNYKRIFVCDIEKVKGRKLFMTDCSLKYELI